MSFNYPKGKLQVGTDATVEYSWTEANHVYLSTVAETNIVVRGVAYHIGVHLYRKGDKWETSEEFRPYISRPMSDPNYKAGASKSAETTIVKLLIDAWTKHAADNAADGVLAQRCKLGQEINKLAQEIEKLETELQAKRAEFRQKSEAEAKLGGPVD